MLLTGDAANTDPACSKSPHHHLIQEAVRQATAAERPAGELIARQGGAALGREVT